MKKSGFTLAELVITIGIIAVAAALCLVVIGDIRPDKNKINVLKHYTAIKYAIEDIFHNETLYHPYPTIVNNVPAMSCEGIGCVDNFEDELKTRLKINNTDGPNNSVWTFTKDATTNKYEISIDLDKNNKNDCTYSSTCDAKKADTFKFKLDEHGDVTPGDALTEAYLKNPLKTNDRKKDIATAKTLLIQKYTPKEQNK